MFRDVLHIQIVIRYSILYHAIEDILMEKTDKFDAFLKTFFNATDGAYTSITAAEINNQTFNVKADIRDMLVEHLGIDNIPRAKSGETQTIRFAISEHMSGINSPFRDIHCKIAKRRKFEMSIYLSHQDFLPKQSLASGDIWFIYFINGSQMPVFGLLHQEEWLHLNSFRSIEDFFLDEHTIADLSEQSPETITIDAKLLEAPPPEVNVDILKSSLEKAGTYRTSSNRERENKKLGRRGEELVLAYEREKLRGIDRSDLADNVEWVAQHYDGFGYDIVSFEVGGDGDVRKIFIEVKTTTGNAEQPFFISENEKLVSQLKGDDYYIYRLYNANRKNSHVDFYRISGSVVDVFLLAPIQYRAIPKKSDK